MQRIRLSLFAATLWTISPAASAAPAAVPAPLPELQAPVELAAGADYDPAFPTQEALLGFASGARVATPAELVKAFEAWDAASPKARLFEHARSYEGRPLHHLVITSERNMARLDAIKAGMARLADARGVGAEERKRLVDTLPGVAWLGYSIHGPETSGADASLSVAYHLLADRSAATAALLDDLVVVINPSVNPDGRNRYGQQLTEHRGAQPNLDDQSTHHGGYWPGGRGNHYLFDLNRDALFGVHPETRGRIAALRSWNPVYFLDGHEMGALDTFLFSPAREPVNPNHPSNTRKWIAELAKDHAAAFDARGWPYYHGEWNEDWYPGYANAWAQFRGAISVLYEQASVAEGGVRQANGTILPYREAVAHQAVSSLANLASLQRNLRQVLADYAAERAKVVAGDSPYARKTFAILPGANAGRVQRFLDLMALQGIEVERLARPAKVDATDQLGRRASVELPAGTLLIVNRQPEARTIAAFLDFDPKLPRAVLERERKELLKQDDSTMYDWTAWSLTMLYGLQAYVVGAELDGEALGGGGDARTDAGGGRGDAQALLLALPGDDDRTVAAAGRLLERGLKLRALDEPTVLDGKRLARGTIVAMRRDNAAGYPQAFRAVASELGLPVIAVGAGLGAGDLADIGGEHFDLLEAPRIAVLSRGGTSSQDFGFAYHLLDQRLGLRHSHLDETALNGVDLRRYNVLLLPERFGPLPEALTRNLKAWVEAGGTLIAIGRSAAQVADEKLKLTAVRTLPEVLDKLEPFRVSLWREWEAGAGRLADDAAIWARTPPAAPPVPWAKAKDDKVDKEELARRDEWMARFMPQGALLAARVDGEHWLGWGSPATLPVLYGNNPVLLAADRAQAPVRLGVYSPTASGGKAGAKGGDEEVPRRAGWAPLPEGQQLTLRMSGLLWPEAAQRLASATYLAQERVGRGQVILFAAPPATRGGLEGTMRLLSNALVLGPGLGAEPAVIP